MNRTWLHLYGPDSLRRTVGPVDGTVRADSTFTSRGGVYKVAGRTISGRRVDAFAKFVRWSLVKSQPIQLTHDQVSDLLDSKPKLKIRFPLA